MPLIEKAFREAVAASDAAFERESSAVGALLGRDRAFRELIRAYLSHPAVLEAACHAVGADHNAAVDAPSLVILPVLQSIGAKGGAE